MTAVLRTLPSRTRQRIPFWLRHRLITLVLVLIVLAGLAARGVWLAGRTHHGAGSSVQRRPPSSAPVVLCQNCAHAYNPDGIGGDISQNDRRPGLRSTATPPPTGRPSSTTRGTLEKPGVGLYVDASPGVAARELRMLTGTPGLSAQIRATQHAAGSEGQRLRGHAGGWTEVASLAYVDRRQNIPLATGGTATATTWCGSPSCRPARQRVELNEIDLYR